MVRLQARDRVVEVGIADEEILAPRGERERERQLARFLDRRADALRREVSGVQPCGPSMQLRVDEILDRRPDQPALRAEPDRLGDDARIVAEAALQVGADRQIGRGDDPADVLHHLVACDRAVPSSDRERVAGAGRRERLEAGGREQACRSRVPRIRNDERLRARVQRTERLAFLSLRRRRSRHRQ